MSKKLKPLSITQKKVLNRLAVALVFSEIEAKVIAPGYEEETGKPYDKTAKDSFMNKFLQQNPEVKQAWKALQKATNAEYQRQSKIATQDEANAN